MSREMNQPHQGSTCLVAKETAGETMGRREVRGWRKGVQRSESPESMEKCGGVKRE